MAMRSDFCAFVLTHGRPDRVYTYETLRLGGYTGPIFLVVDDGDKTLLEYQKRYGDEVLVFSKDEVAKTMDSADNFGDRRVIVYARNVCFEFAERLGFRYFIELDDDYNSGFYIRFRRNGEAYEYGNTPRIKRSIDEIFASLVEFLENTKTTSIALSQGGDHIGGNADGKKRPRLTRKAMNSFVCSTERPFKFSGRLNEDVNTYVCEGRRGRLFFTTQQAQVNQKATQSNAGGMTDIYLDGGTYVKSFYSLLYAPSCVRIGTLGDPRSPHYRIHHAIQWQYAVPKILRETHRRGRPSP